MNPNQNITIEKATNLTKEWFPSVSPNELSQAMAKVQLFNPI